MIIRAFHPSDLTELTEIHAKFFRHEFDLPDFLNYICAFTVEDESGPIVYGGIRSIAECVAVSNQERSVRTRLKALYKLLDASEYVTQKSGYDQIYAWVRNTTFGREMKRNGFRQSDGESLIFDL